MKVHPQDGLRCHDMHTKPHKDWLSHSKVDGGGGGGGGMIHRQPGDHVSLFLFFQNKESKLKLIRRWVVRSKTGIIIWVGTDTVSIV
jgi:hypothetical protein